MGKDQVFSGDIDPEIADLLGTSSLPPGKKNQPKAQPSPDFSDLFGEASGGAATPAERKSDVDLTRKKFAPIAKFQEDKPHNYLDDPDFYKKCLANEGEVANQFHAIFSKYLQAKDPKDKGVFRQGMIPVFWQLLARIAHRAVGQPVPPKQLLLRFGALLPTLMDPPIKDAISRVVLGKEVDEPVFYLDEWFKMIGTGKITPSATDEVKTTQSDDYGRFQALITKAQGRRDGAEGLLKAKAQERHNLEKNLAEKAGFFSDRRRTGDDEGYAPYNDLQKRTMNDISELMREMIKVDRELQKSYADFSQAEDDLRKLTEKMDGLQPDSKVNMQLVGTEFETVRQMAKMCIGRQGNHFPLLSKDYFHGSIRDIATRENVVTILTWLESIDSEAYCRSYKNTLNRIVPYVILMPNYGDNGVCWEPFDRFNRATSRGRIAIPMYPKNVQLAVVNAVADLRWQVAKEKASYYWMEEGLTGNYYQWFQSKRLKGDVKEYFVQDYILWIFKESEGVQKLEKEVRNMFWRYIPFSQAIKEKLKTRSYVYQDLYQRDLNRSMSDGY